MLCPIRGWLRTLLLVGLFMSAAAATQAADYALTVSVTPEKIVYPGELVTHVYTVRNTGLHNDTYDLALLPPLQWVALPIQSTVTVNSGEQAFVFVNLLVAESAEAKAYDVTLQCTSQSDPAVTAEATGVVQVQSVADVELTWDVAPSRPVPGQRLGGRARVRNTGNVLDRYQLEFSVQPEWPTQLQFDELQLAPGEEAVVDVHVEVPSTAEQGIVFRLVLTAASLSDPSAIATLTVSSTVLPPPPELVGGSLFPLWDVSLDISFSQAGGPTFLVMGQGSIAEFGDVFASSRFSIAGVEQANAQWMGEQWGISVYGGTVAGRFLGVSGTPLFLMSTPGGASGRLLFTDNRKGVFVSCEVADCDVSVAYGSNADAGYTFMDAWASYTFEGPFSLSGFFSNAQSGSKRALAFEIKAETESEALGCGQLDMAAAYLKVPADYPRQQGREKYEVSANWSGCPFPMDLLGGVTKFNSDTQTPGYAVYDTGFTFGLGPITVPELLDLELNVGSRKRESNDTPPTIQEFRTFFNLNLSGTLYQFEWALSHQLQSLKDAISGSETTLNQLSVTFGGEIWDIPFALTFSPQLISTAGVTAVRSPFSLGVEFPDVFGSPAFELRGRRNNVVLGTTLSGSPCPGGEVAWTIEIGVCENALGSFYMALIASFPVDFRLCGPIKGRVTGEVYLDENANGMRDASEQGVKDVVLALDGLEAVSGSSGLFRFIPVPPGAYELTLSHLPPGTMATVELPKEIELAAGEEPAISIALRPHGWITGSIFYDDNENGAYDPLEEGIPDIGVSISGPEMQKTIYTTRGGRFSEKFAAGIYVIKLLTETLPPRSELVAQSEVTMGVNEGESTNVDFPVIKKKRAVVVTFGPPTARFSVVPEEPTEGDTVTLDASDSTAINAEIVAYQWSITINERQLEISGRTAKMRIDERGEWHVVLTIVDANGLSGKAEHRFQVSQ